MRKAGNKTMKLINMPRGSGKTTRLLYKSESTGYPILVATDKLKQYLIDMARSSGIEIAEVFTARDVAQRNVHGYECVLVDEIDFVMREMIKSLSGAEVDSATITSECKGQKEKFSFDANSLIYTDAFGLSTKIDNVETIDVSIPYKFINGKHARVTVSDEK